MNSSGCDVTLLDASIGFDPIDCLTIPSNPVSLLRLMAARLNDVFEIQRGTSVVVTSTVRQLRWINLPGERGSTSS